MDTYENKYKEALERAKAMIKVAANQDEAIGFANTIFPELKESEDEKIRGELIKHLKEGAEGYEPAGGTSDYQRWLAWLEKQGEQKFEMKTAEESLGIDSDTYNKIVDECIFGEEDDKVRTTIINEFEQCSEWCCANGLTKEDCIDWLQSLKGRIQPKQGWSEDDNLYYDDICEILMNLLHSERTGINKAAVQKDLDWLGRIKEKTQRNKEDATADEIINYFKCQTRDEPSRRDTHNKWISWVKNKK